MYIVHGYRTHTHLPRKTREELPKTLRNVRACVGKCFSIVERLLLPSPFVPDESDSPVLNKCINNTIRFERFPVGRNKSRLERGESLASGHTWVVGIPVTVDNFWVKKNRVRVSCRFDRKPRVEEKRQTWLMTIECRLFDVFFRFSFRFSRKITAR